jgi:hypothetical protein
MSGEAAGGSGDLRLVVAQEQQTAIGVPEFHSNPELVLIVDAHNERTGKADQLPYPPNPFENLNVAYRTYGVYTMRSVIEDVRAGQAQPSDETLQDAYRAVNEAANIASGNHIVEGVRQPRQPLGMLGTLREEGWALMPPGHFPRFHASTKIADQGEKRAVQRDLALEALASIAVAAAPDKAEPRRYLFPRSRALAALAAVVATAAVNFTERQI